MKSSPIQSDASNRLRMDVWYVDNWSLRLDLYILAKAFILLFQRRGVYGPGGITRDPDLEAEPVDTKSNL